MGHGTPTKMSYPWIDVRWLQSKVLHTQPQMLAEMSIRIRTVEHMPELSVGLGSSPNRTKCPKVWPRHGRLGHDYRLATGHALRSGWTHRRQDMDDRLWREVVRTIEPRLPTGREHTLGVDSLTR